MKPLNFMALALDSVSEADALEAYEDLVDRTPEWVDDVIKGWIAGGVDGATVLQMLTRKVVSRAESIRERREDEASASRRHGDPNDRGAA